MSAVRETGEDPRAAPKVKPESWDSLGIGFPFAGLREQVSVDGWFAGRICRDNDGRVYLESLEFMPVILIHPKVSGQFPTGRRVLWHPEPDGCVTVRILKEEGAE